MKLNKDIVKRIQNDCADALAPVAAKYGLRLDRKSCTFHADSCPVAFKLTAPPEEATETAEAIAFKRHAHCYGLDAGQLGQSFKQRGRTFTICGLSARAKKYPILATGDDGKTYKFAPDGVRWAMGLENMTKKSAEVLRGGRERPPRGFFESKGGTLTGPHRNTTCCPTCAAEHPEIVDVYGEFFWVPDPAERAEFEADQRAAVEQDRECS